VLSIVAGVLLCFGGFGGGLFFLLREASEGPRNATTAFIGDLKAQDWAGAYGQLCQETRSRFTVEQFTQTAQSNGEVRDHSITNFRVENTNGRQSATVDTDLELTDGSTEDHTFPLVKEGEQWKVCGNPY
jgi:Domain of unknown function (DUF4878)